MNASSTQKRENLIDITGMFVEMKIIAAHISHEGLSEELKRMIKQKRFFTVIYAGGQFMYSGCVTSKGIGNLIVGFCGMMDLNFKMCYKEI